MNNKIQIIPKVKKETVYDSFCCAEGLQWVFAEGTDERVVRAAERICESRNGIKVYVSHGTEAGEGYSLSVSETEIKIEGKGAAGAFYALSSLKMLLKKSEGKLPCCEIEDEPDFKYRGFYQDVTRGRIPTLGTLKKLADTMADYKLNSLQLYVEHSFEFNEYGFCREELGYLSADEIRSLDEYCKERFIELIPSLSTFGHLYHLLQSDTYKHLCEIKDYQPQKHHFAERMRHHTINPLLEESYELIKSLIDQHLEAFSSNYFNICCDETFDLGKGVNAGADTGELYIGFVKKIVHYLESKGKKVMMWADIVLEHEEKIPELSEKLVFLNWDYLENPEEAKVAALENYTQIVCPGSSSWNGFCERLDIAASNIIKLAAYGEKYGAAGMLNTNWGDFGHPATIEMAMYSLILGAAVSWNNTCEIDAAFREEVGKYHYGNPKAVEMLYRVGEASKIIGFFRLFLPDEDKITGTFEEYEKGQQECRKLIEEVKEAEFISEDMREEFLLAFQGQSLLIEWCAGKDGYEVCAQVDFEKWLAQFEKIWLKGSKKSELYVMTDWMRKQHYGKE